VLSFRWGFSIRYMSGGRPVYMIPEGSDCFGTCENFDQPTASFVPDIAGDYTLTLYVTDEDGECLTDRVTITAIDDPDDSPEPSDGADFSVKRVLCYPSPFADQISFGFIGSGVPDAIHVTVYDLSGKLVWQVEARGVSVTTWDGTSVRGDRLANGGYICVIRIAGGGKVHTERTMIFIRR